MASVTQEYVYYPDLAGLIADIVPDSIISRTINRTAHSKTVLFGFAAGQSLSEHSAGQTAILHILRGEATLTLGSDTYPASAGAWVQMPPRLPHSVVAKTDLHLLLILLNGDAR